MEKSGDFLQLLGPDLSNLIFSTLDHPTDIVRASSVSRSWRQFVIENGFCKSLCLKLFPELSRVAHAIEVENVIELMQVASNNSKAVENAEKNHKVYAILAQGISPILRKDCLLKAISATSTDRYPAESIHNTLEPRDRVGYTPSYWSSRGVTDENVPERLTYKLISSLCSITEINIHPFQVYFHNGHPVYSAKAVRFRLGHFKYVEIFAQHKDALDMDDFFEWTYMSPKFPMAQENCLQRFKLPEPVLCIGGILQIELLGRAQRCWDGLFYFGVSHVQVVGRTLLPGFEVKCIKGKCLVSYSLEDKACTSFTNHGK